MPPAPRFSLPRLFRRNRSDLADKLKPTQEPATPSPSQKSIVANCSPARSAAVHGVDLWSTVALPPPQVRDDSVCAGAELPLHPTDELAELRASSSAGSNPRASSDSVLRLSLDQKAPLTHAEEVDIEDEDDLGPLPVFTIDRPTPEIALRDDRSAEGQSVDIPLQQEGAPEPSIPTLDLTHPHDPTLHPDAELDPTPVPIHRTENHDDRSEIPANDADAEITHAPTDAPEKRGSLPNNNEHTALHQGSEGELTSDTHTIAKMPQRKVWVKRPGASATLVQIQEGDLVDDVRDMILKKYANSLGRTFDAPDMILRIVQRTDHGGPRSDRLLGPEEDICRTIDAYYSGKQNVEEALIIDIPAKRTPRPSPHVFQPHSYHTVDEYRPLENGTDYFPPMPAIIPTTVPQTSSSHESRSSHHHLLATDQHGNPRSIAVLNTGQIAPLPSPGGTRRHRDHRPRYQRTHTSSPTIVTHPAAPNPNAPTLNPANLAHRRPRLSSTASEQPPHANGIPTAPPLPTPPAPEAAPTNKSVSTPPTPNGAAHPHRNSRSKKSRRLTPDGKMARSRHQHGDSLSSNANISSSMLDGSVPPINVLIVEDNIINLRILQGLMKRLKVRWETAMNGQIAVDKWKAGGFHLVLMDIQMPIMNGLEATKAIRQLERENGIGVFSSTESTPVDGDGKDGSGEGDKDADNENGVAKEKPERLPMSEGSFKSPIIIVALTASSLQSDRHEALAAGCNDFLTKPVDFMWLQRKVKEWGCMQALIDFDGWRKWKDYASKEEAGKTEQERQAEREKEERARVKMEKLAKLQEKQKLKRQEDERQKRASTMEAAAAMAGDDGSADTEGSSSTVIPATAETPAVAINGTDEDL